MLPFHVFEAGFDDEKFESLYRTIFFHVESHEQAKFLRAMSSDEETQQSLTAEEKALKSRIEPKINPVSKSGKPLGDEKKSLAVVDYLRFNGLKFDIDFLRENESEESKSIDWTEKEA